LILSTCQVILHFWKRLFKLCGSHNHNCSKVNTTSTHSEKRRNYNRRSAIMQPYGIQLTGWREMTTLMIRCSAFLLKSSFPVTYYTIWALEHMRESPTLLEVVAAENFVASLHSAISQLLDLISTFIYQQWDLAFIRKCHYEIATLLHFCLELNSFFRYSSSSGERLYDIERISCSKIYGLSKKQISISAVYTVLPIYIQNMKQNYLITKSKPNVLKMQSSATTDKSTSIRFRMQKLRQVFANSRELFCRDILPPLFFLAESTKLRIWFNFVTGSRKTHDLTSSYFSFFLVRSRSTRSTRSSYDFHILTALAAATKCYMVKFRVL